MLDRRDARSLLLTAHRNPDAHPEDAFIAAFAAFVHRVRGPGPLHELALEYAGDLVEDIGHRCELDTDCAACRALVRDWARRSRHILARDLCEWVQGDTLPGEPGAAMRHVA